MLNLGHIFLTILLVLRAACPTLTSFSITKLSPCACEYDGHIYNLSSLAKKEGARFIETSKRYEYGYNPCVPFTQGDTQKCKNVAICYWSDDGQMYDGIGFQDDVSCQVNKGIVEFVFKQRGTRMGMKSTVQLKCNKSKTQVGEAEMKVTKDAGEPILEVEHKCCCPDGCPANIPHTVSPSTLPPTIDPTLHVVYWSSDSNISIVWIAVVAAVVFIVILIISIALCLRRPRTGYPGIVQHPVRERLLFPVNFNDQRTAAQSIEEGEEEDRIPDYGAVRGPTPPPPYDDADDNRDDDHDHDHETTREGVEHEERPSDVRGTLPFGVPEDGGFASPVQVSERISK